MVCTKARIVLDYDSKARRPSQRAVKGGRAIREHGTCGGGGAIRTSRGWLQPSLLTAVAVMEKSEDSINFALLKLCILISSHSALSKTAVSNCPRG